MVQGSGPGGHEHSAVRAWLARMPAGAWTSCPGCRSPVHHRRLRLGTCPRCGHHFRLGARERVEALADPGSFRERDGAMVSRDPLAFVDTRPYPERISDLRRRTGSRDAAVYGTALIGGHPTVLCVLDFSFLGGSMGSVVGEKVTRAAERATTERIPLVVCATSGGARMQEGIFSLLQMAKTAAAFERLHRAGVLFVSILTDPVYGGVSASFAALGDVIVAEPRARAGFAGPQVIEQTIRQKLPEGFQTAEFLLEKGHIDAVVPRRELRSFVSRLLLVHSRAATQRAAARPEARRPAPVRTESTQIDPTDSRPRVEDVWRTVQLARDAGRPHLGEYTELMLEVFVELHGDRWREDDPAIVGGPALLGGRAVMVLGHRKGRGTQECLTRNFGMPHPAGYRKAERLMRYAERFGLPLVTFIDTPGAYPGLRAEEENQSGAIARDLVTMTGLHTPIVTVVIGEGGSGGALALGVCDRLLMLEHTTYSVISPEGCATILFGDAGRAPQAAAALRLTAQEMLAFAIADEIVPEPGEGAHTDHAGTAAAVRAALLGHLDELCTTPLEALLAQRYARLRSHGEFREEPWEHGALPDGNRPATGTSPDGNEVGVDHTTDTPRR